MGRNRSFDEATVVAAATTAFRKHRGSLYQAFGPGFALPGTWCGTCTQDGDTYFWNASSPIDTVVVELAHEPFTRLYLTAAHPRELVDQINAAIPAG